MDIVLASASPRRRELLTMLGLKDFKIIPAQGKEVLATGMTAGEAVCSIALAKAEEVSKLCHDDDTVIAADTVVSLDGEILGKPADEKDAFNMLKRLSGRPHNVYTGITVMRGKTAITQYQRTMVVFRELTEREINAYIATGEPMDKAGAYGAQGIGSLFVESIEGDFFNVMGLPLCMLSKMLEKVGVILI